MIGTTIGGKYTIVRQLGEGGMGAVYEGRHTGTGRRVAIKVISGTLDPELVARFELEARAAGAIESEHIAQVLDVGHDEAAGAPFLVMEFLVGEDLSQLFERLGPIPWELAFRIGVQACLGLEKAHAQGVIHRDIKPANLFLTERDGGELRVKVVDFGIAKIAADVVAQPVQPKKALTRVGSFVGSPLYMSPEQARGGAVDHRADIWSLGIVLYQAIAGRTPFEHVSSIGEFVATVCTTPVPTVRTYAAWIDPTVAALVERALATDPAQRYQSVAEMRAALEPYLPQGASIRGAMLSSAAAGPQPSAVPAPTAAATPVGGRASMPSGMGAVVTPMPGGIAQPSAPAWHATVPGQPLTAAPIPSTATPMPSGAHLLGAAPVGVPAPPPPAPRRGSAGPLIAIAVLGLAAGSGLAAAFALGWLGRKPPPPVASATASASAPPPVDTAAVAAARASLIGTWKSDAGVVYDAVPNGESVEWRIRDPESLAAQGYVAGDTHFALRTSKDEPGVFRVAARIRPTPPKGTVYDKTRSRTTCENTWREVDGKHLRAELTSDRLVVKIVRIDPQPTAFLREGIRVVGCTGLAGAPAVETELVLTTGAAPTPPPPKLGPWPKPIASAPHDAGAPHTVADAGRPPPAIVDAGPPPPPPPPVVVDAGGPPEPQRARPVGAPCQRDGECTSSNCYNKRCRRNTPGSRCLHNGHCASRQCAGGTCQ